jgi:hypothetical protein
MRAILLLAVLVIGGLSAGCGSSSRDPVEGSGPATLESGASVTSISCAAPGECAGGGFYNASKEDVWQPLVISQTDGTWAKAIEVPGAAALNGGRGARVTSISCAAPGECAAGGFYKTDWTYSGAFVASEANGKWGNAIKVPGLAKLDTVGVASVTSISCGAPGECVAGGNFNNDSLPFLVSETNGSWGNAIEVPGVAKLNPGYDTTLTSLSCAAAGECAAGGYYDSFRNGNESGQAWVASERNGSWGPAIEVPGIATLNTGTSAGVTSISCAAPGECAAGGSYATIDGNYYTTAQVFVVNETNGIWRNAIEVPGTATLGAGRGVNSISCAAPGECAAGGYYVENSADGPNRPFVVSETNGKWGNALEVPGAATLKPVCGPSSFHRCSPSGAEVTSVSCAAAGECAAAGAAIRGGPFLSTYPINFPTFVVSETKGRWGNATEVPGTATLNSISCAAPGECAAGGGYYQAFVVSQTNGDWGSALRFK